MQSDISENGFLDKCSHMTFQPAKPSFSNKMLCISISVLINMRTPKTDWLLNKKMLPAIKVNSCLHYFFFFPQNHCHTNRVYNIYTQSIQTQTGLSKQCWPRSDTTDPMGLIRVNTIATYPSVFGHTLYQQVLQRTCSNFRINMVRR